MEFLLKASAITALFYICYTLFLRGETFFESNRWFLLSGLVLSVCVPFLVIPIYVEYTPVSNFVIANGNSATPPILEESFNYLKLIPLLYGIGVIFFLTKLCIEFSSLFKLLNSNKTNSLKGTKFIETEDAVSPFSFFNYIVYNPKQFNTTELGHIINHEKVHARQWHSLDIILVQLATIIFWFNPFIWLYKKDLQQNLEFIADQSAQRISACQKSYQHLLIKATVPNQQLVLANNFYNSLIKKRIVMLHKSKSHKLNVLKYVLVIPLLALFLMSFNTKEIYIESDKGSTSDALGDIEMVIITKDFKDADFEKIKKEFKSKGVTLKFKGIKRNNNGEIIAIKIEASTAKSNANFNTSSEDAIKPIKITYNSEGNSISIGNGDGHLDGEHEYHFKSKAGNHKILKSGSGSNVFVIEEEHEAHDNQEGHKEHKVYKKIKHSNDDDKERVIEVIIENEDENVKKEGNTFKLKESKVFHIESDEGDHTEEVYIIKKDKDGKRIKEKINLNDEETRTWIEDENNTGKKHKIILKVDNDKDGLTFISSDEKGNPLIIIDGKESTMEVMEKLFPDSIEIMNVLKGEKATNIYGEKGKAGVIIITTKK